MREVHEDKVSTLREIGSLFVQEACAFSETRRELCKNLVEIRLYNQRVFDYEWVRP